MGTETNKDERNTPEYLSQLLKDKKQIQALPNVFIHAEKLLDEEINRVRVAIFHHRDNRKPLSLPDNNGPIVQLQEKLFVPAKQHPDFNFVGRILGPRGMTAKELEQFTGCKIMVRGKGSMRDKKKEEANRGKPNWEHLNEELHVLITVEDSRERADLKLKTAIEEVKKLLIPAAEGEDELKKKQLMELAILNGTYRDSTRTIVQAHPFSIANISNMAVNPWRGPDLSLPRGATLAGHRGNSMFVEMPRLITPAQAAAAATLQLQQIRSPTPAGPPIIFAPRMQSVNTSSPGLMNGAPPPLMSPADMGIMCGNPYDFPYTLAPTTLLEYPTSPEQMPGAVPKMRRTLSGVREHPYTRVTTLP
ncbi:protein quaking-B-like isoform X2 [Gigantopelta aegis]|uniref:protein quaking-B-like isoform X2 n=1 Tax=Gigantopelta aegis TaxID=1735272 RepID=UPI001B887C21|nr:protein quaking-B-like isoform X2 [Gigantopelta aegis]